MPTAESLSCEVITAGRVSEMHQHETMLKSSPVAHRGSSEGTLSAISAENMSDLQPFKHGDEGTHSACAECVAEFGDKVQCCACTGHACFNH